jgi:hypothetical protein
MGNATSLANAGGTVKNEFVLMSKGLDGKIEFAGDEGLIREYIEQNPEQWLRLLALASEEKEDG